MGTRPAATRNNRELPEAEFEDRVHALWQRYANCDLCTYDCGVDRTDGETGACRVDDTAYVFSYFDHHGKEDVIRGTNPSGTIILAHCNMTHVFCQNVEFSTTASATNWA